MTSTSSFPPVTASVHSVIFSATASCCRVESAERSYHALLLSVGVRGRAMPMARNSTVTKPTMPIIEHFRKTGP